jgi:hypothetical protein
MPNQLTPTAEHDVIGLCEKLRKSRVKLTHAREWATDIDYEQIITECVDGCERLLRFQGDRPIQLAYLRQAQDMAEYLMSTFNYLLTKTGLMERCYRVCPVPTALSNATSFAFSRRFDEEAFYFTIADTALKLGGVLTPEQVSGMNVQWDETKASFSVDWCKLFLQNVCEAREYLFSNEYSAKAYSTILARLLARVFDAGDAEWGMMYVLANRDALQGLMDLDSGFNRADLSTGCGYMGGILRAVIQAAETEQPLVAFHEYDPTLYQGILSDQGMSICKELCHKLIARELLDLSRLPTLPMMEPKHVEHIAHQALFEDAPQPLTFEHIENFYKLYIHVGGKPTGLKSKLIRSDAFKDSKRIATGLIEAMETEKKFKTLLSRSMEKISEKAYAYQLSSLIVTLHMDKGLGGSLRNQAVVSRMCAYFDVVEGADFMWCINATKHHLSPEDMTALVVMSEYSRHPDRTQIVDRATELMATQASLDSLSTVSYEDLQALRRLPDRLIPDSLIRKVSWKSGKILEETLEKDLGL